MGGGVELKSTPDLDILYFVFTISRYEWKVNRIFKSKMKKMFKPLNYLENYSSCVVYVPSCAVCISTLASSAVPPSNQHTAASTLAGQVITYIVIKSHVVNQNSNLSSD